MAALAKAQHAGELSNAFPPGFLLVAILTLANAWSDASWYGDALDPAALKRPTTLKKHLAEAVRRYVRQHIDKTGPKVWRTVAKCGAAEPSLKFQPRFDGAFQKPAAWRQPAV